MAAALTGTLVLSATSDAAEAQADVSGPASKEGPAFRRHVSVPEIRYCDAVVQHEPAPEAVGLFPAIGIRKGIMSP